MLSEEWLKKLNKEFRDAGVEQRRRPWEAIRRYSDEFHVSIDISSGLAKQIFEWFAAHSKPGAHQVGSLYESVYFYDSAFWSVSIPIVYGTAKLNALESLYQFQNTSAQNYYLTTNRLGTTWCFGLIALITD